MENNKYRMIVTDYDGTLCNSKKVVTKRTRAAVSRFVNEGGKFVICTTRPYAGIEGIARDLGLNDQIITNQGAIVHNLRDGGIFMENRLKAEQTKSIIEFFRAQSEVIYAVSEGQLLSYKASFYDKLLSKFIGAPIMPCIGEMTQCPCLKDTAQVIVGAFFENKVREMTLKGQKQFPDLEVGMCDKHSLNITQKGVTKGSAIDAIANYHGISKEQILAFGDSENDKSMFEHAGRGVAMENSMEQLKGFASDCCDSNDNDGVAKFIESVCF